MRKIRSRIPFVQQMEISDCGAACLAMVLAYHGRRVPLEELRRVTATGRDGVDALSMVKSGRQYGMHARGVKVEIESLGHVKPASILHWNFDHFVVFERVTRAGVIVVDPANGRMRVPLAEFSRSFTGVAVEFEPAQDFEQAAGEQRSVWRYMKPLIRGAKLLLRIGLVSLLIQLLALASPILVGVLVDRIVPQSERGLLPILMVGLSSMVVFLLVSSFVRAHLLVSLRTHVDLRMTLGFVNHLSDLPYSFFLERSTGDLMARLNSNATIREIMTSTALSALLDGALVAVYLILIFALSPVIGLVVAGLAIFQILVLVVSRRRQQHLMSENLVAQARQQGYMVQMLTGMETLKAAGSEPRAVERWTNLFVNEINVAVRRGRLGAIVDSVLGAFRTASPLAILATGALLVLDGKLTLGDMLAANALAAGFLGPLATLVSTATQFQLLRSYLERINDVLDAKPEQFGQATVQAPKLTGAIRVEGVSFAYSASAPKVVKGVSFEVEAGQSIAIVGRSGSGKSTLAKLLLGMYSPNEGEIFYDDLDLRSMEGRSLRSQLGIVTQGAYYFGASIRSNIALVDPTLHLDEVRRASRLACIDDEIEAMPMKYDTVLADGGASLSGGQRQRIALARALAGSPAIVLLDEATSELDTLTEAAVYANLETAGCTRIVIAHRLSTIESSDLILVMEDGSIAERGNHKQLMKMGGRYAELVSAQVKPTIRTVGSRTKVKARPNSLNQNGARRQSAPKRKSSPARSSSK